MGEERKVVPSVSQGQPGAGDGDTVAVSFIPQPYMKAPAVDPYLRAGTVTSQAVTVAGYSLPPILRGVQPGRDFDGKPVDRTVSVLWMSRRQIDDMARAMARQHPELAQGLEVMRTFMSDMDTMRDAVAGEVSCAAGDLARGNPDRAIAALRTARDLLGRWNDSRRLMLG